MGLTLVPSHPACSQVLSQLPPAMSAPVPAPMPARVQYKLGKWDVYLKKEVGPQSNIVRKLEPQSVVDVSDICIYQNTTRLLCHCDNGDEGWADYRRDGKNRNMVQTKPEGPPEGPGDESARSVTASAWSCLAPDIGPHPGATDGSRPTPLTPPPTKFGVLCESVRHSF